MAVPPLLGLCYALLCGYPTDSAQLQHVGGLLSGYAAISAVVIAALKLPSEFANFQNQKRYEKGAEVAGQTIGAVLRLLSTSLSALRRYENNGECPPETTEALAVVVGGWDKIDEYAASFQAALEVCEAYLPQDAVSVTREVHELHSKLASDVAQAKYLIESEARRMAEASKDGRPYTPTKLWIGLMHMLASDLREATPRIAPLQEKALATLRRYTIGGE